MKTPQQNQSLINWLIFTAFMVLAMAVIGAITRLTESGLSMVEWRPLIGALPPMNEAEWERVFALYKQIPEYTAQNSWMTLSDFKQIFFWEWFHRLWGRLIGLVFALPLVYFWVRGHIPQGYKGRLLFLLFLGSMQGVMGWYMVRSGLSELTSVSHYRLAAHLFLAVIVFACLVWTIFDLKHRRVQWSWNNFCPSFMRSNATQALAGLPARCSRTDTPTNKQPVGYPLHGLISLGFLYVTIIWGAFVAGLDGGMIYNTWPMMGDGFIPSEATIKGAFHENPAGAQFFHRWIAFATGLVILTYAMRVKSMGLAIMLFAQIGLGILTLISQVAIPLAALHQASAFILVAVLLQQIHKSFR